MNIVALPERVDHHISVTDSLHVIQNRRLDALENVVQIWLCLEINDRTGHSQEWRGCLTEQQRLVPRQ